MRIQINQLVPTALDIDGKEIELRYKRVLTMIDGKVCSTLIGTSSQLYYIRQAATKEINDLEKHSERSYDTTIENK